MLTIKIEENCIDALKEMNVAYEDDAVVMTVRDGDLLMGLGAMRIYESMR